MFHFAGLEGLFCAWDSGLALKAHSAGSAQAVGSSGTAASAAGEMSTFVCFCVHKNRGILWREWSGPDGLKSYLILPALFGGVD